MLARLFKVKKIKILPHAKSRIEERGTTESEVIETLKFGKEVSVK